MTRAAFPASALAAFAALAACGPGPKNPKLDAGPHTDGPVVDDHVFPDDLEPPDAPDPDSNEPYRHTVAVDGADDFFAPEQLPTTSTAYGARVTWDETNLYLGYHGPDLAPGATDADQKWLFVYVDIDPGVATGATTTITYRTQHATFPTGFGAEIHARWKADASFREVSQYNGSTWTQDATDMWGHAADFVELALPRSLFNGATTIGVVTWMINEKDLAESSYAGLYANNFTDGYAANLSLAKYLRVDFASPLAPSDLANVRP